MAQVLKVLGQLAPSATTDTDLYTVPALTSTIGSSCVICNRGSTTILVRLAVRPAGAAIANKHYLIYDNPLGANDTMEVTVGMTLATTDVVTVRCDSANSSFTLFGQEKT